MAYITTRSGKGSPLTNDELDANFNNLNNDKLESSDLSDYLTLSAADARFEAILTDNTRQKFFRQESAPQAVADGVKEGDMWYKSDTEDLYFWRETSPNVFAWELFSTGTANSDTLDGGAY